MTPVRIFISSPGDVALERQIARRVISSLQSEFGDDPAIEPYFLEYEPMRLTKELTTYRDALAISTKLAAEDPDSSKLQRDLLVSHNAIGDVLKAQGNLDGVLGAYRDIVTIASALATREPDNSEWQRDLDIGIGRIGDLAYTSVLARDFAKALEAADQAISLAPGKTWLYTNRAHALMFLRRTDEARALYLKYRGVPDVQGGKSWEPVVLEDFTELRKAGLSNPLMTEVESSFAATR
jgi:tetratricopeptide (TPR) repeat protein